MIKINLYRNTPRSDHHHKGFGHSKIPPSIHCIWLGPIFVLIRR